MKIDESAVWELIFKRSGEITPMGLLDRDGRWLKVTQGLVDLFGYSEAELLKMTFQEMTRFNNELRADLEMCEKVVNGEISYFSIDKEYLCKRRGVFVRCLLHVYGVYDENGEFMFFLSILTDPKFSKDMSFIAILTEKLLHQIEKITFKQFFLSVITGLLFFGVLDSEKALELIKLALGVF